MNGLDSPTWKGLSGLWTFFISYGLLLVLILSGVIVWATTTRVIERFQIGRVAFGLLAAGPVSLVAFQMLIGTATGRILEPGFFVAEVATLFFFAGPVLGLCQFVTLPLARKIAWAAAGVMTVALLISVLTQALGHSAWNSEMLFGGRSGILFLVLWLRLYEVRRDMEASRTKE